MDYAIIDSRGYVNNIIVSNDLFFVTNYAESIGCTAIEYDIYDNDENKVARIGEIYVDGLFIDVESARDSLIITTDEYHYYMNNYSFIYEKFKETKEDFYNEVKPIEVEYL